MSVSFNDDRWKIIIDEKKLGWAIEYSNTETDRNASLDRRPCSNAPLGVCSVRFLIDCNTGQWMEREVGGWSKTASKQTHAR